MNIRKIVLYREGCFCTKELLGCMGKRSMFFLFQHYMNREWDIMERGFGNPEKEFWLGLSKVYE